MEKRPRLPWNRSFGRSLSGRPLKTGRPGRIFSGPFTGMWPDQQTGPDFQRGHVDRGEFPGFFGRHHGPQSTGLTVLACRADWARHRTVVGPPIYSEAEHRSPVRFPWTLARQLHEFQDVNKILGGFRVNGERLFVHRSTRRDHP